MRTYKVMHRKRGIVKAKIFTSIIKASNADSAERKILDRLKHKHTILDVKWIRCEEGRL